MKSFFGKKNYWGVGIALALLVVGFWMLGQRPAGNKLALDVAPFVLLFAYLVVLPMSLWKNWNKRERDSSAGV